MIKSDNTKVLHFTSDTYHQDFLMLEDLTGTLMPIKHKHLK